MTFSIGGRLPQVQPAGIGGGAGTALALDLTRAKLRTRNWAWTLIPWSQDGHTKAWGGENGLFRLFRRPWSGATKRKLVIEARDGALHTIATTAPAPEANMKKTFQRINELQGKPGKTLSQCKDEIATLQGSIARLESMRMTLEAKRVSIPLIRDGDRRAILKAQMAEEVSRAVNCAYEQACAATTNAGAKAIIDDTVQSIANQYEPGSLEHELAEEVGRVILGNPAPIAPVVAAAGHLTWFGPIPYWWTPKVIGKPLVAVSPGATTDGVAVPNSSAKSVADYAKDKANDYAKQQMSAVTALTHFTGTPDIAVISANIKTCQKSLEKLTDEVFLSLCNADEHTYSTQDSFDTFYKEMWKTAKELSGETQARLDTLSISLGLPVLRKEKREKSAKHFIKQGLKNNTPSLVEVGVNAALMAGEFAAFTVLGGGSLPDGTLKVVAVGLAVIAHFAALRAVNWYLDKDN